MTTAIDKTLTTAWTNLYALFNIPTTESFILQNKGSDWVTLQVVSQQPSVNNTEGIVLRTFDRLRITPDAGGCWARVTNDVVVNAIVVYHPDVGLSEQIGSSSGGSGGEVSGEVSIKGARTTLVQEQLVASRTDHINVQFQYNVPLNQETSDIRGTSSGGATITHQSSMARLQSVSGASAYIQSADSIRYFPGHEFAAEMTALFSSTSGSATFGVGDFGATGDSIAFTSQIGQFGILFKSNGVSQFIPQSQFNVDKLDGTGTSGKTIDPTKLNLYTFRGGLYGILPLIFGWYAGADVGYVTCHIIDRTNQQTSPHLGNPTLPMFAEVTGEASLSTASWRGGICGETPRSTKADRHQNVDVSDKSIVANAITPVITLRNNTVFKGKQNHVKARYGTVTLAVDGTKTFTWYIFKGAALVGANFTPKNTETSTVDYDVTATSITPPYPDNIGGSVMGKYDNARINLFQGDVTLAVYPGETITLAVKSTGNGVVSAFVRWIEEF